VPQGVQARVFGMKSLTGVGISAFRVMQPQIFADVLQEAQHPTMFVMVNCVKWFVLTRQGGATLSGQVIRTHG
jgi:hypothetical protein